MDDIMNQPPFRVMMWCVPRSISTAITKCFSFIDNTQIWFEPYCYRYLMDWKARERGWFPADTCSEAFDVDAFLTTNHALMKGTPLEREFDPEEVDKSMITYDGIARQLNNLPPDQSVFVKDMSYGISNNYHWLPKKEAGFKYTFLIRDPDRIYPSIRTLNMKQISLMLGVEFNEEAYDMLESSTYMPDGYYYRCHYDLWKYVKENIDPHPIVIDGDELVANPADMLPRFFRACGMPWDDSMLSWDESPDKAKTWRILYDIVPSPRYARCTNGTNDISMCAHERALASSAFRRTKPKIPRSEMTPDVLKAIGATEGYYKEMAATRIMSF